MIRVSRWSLATMLAIGLCLQGAACQRVGDNPANPIGAACNDVSANLQECAYATYATFVVIEELALKVAQDQVVPDAARQRIVRADERAKPVADSLYDALRQYERIRVEVSQGKSNAEKLLTVTANLNKWVTEAAPLVRALVDAVNDAAKGKT